MAHKGAYVTNLNEFVNSNYQRYNHRRYINQLQNLLKAHQRNRRCLPNPAKSIHSKQAKRPLPTSPCFQQYPQQQYSQQSTDKQDSNRLNISYRPVSPGRSILSSPRSRSRSSCYSRAALAGSALSNFNSITCFSTSTRTPTPTPKPLKKRLDIPTVIITSEGHQQLFPIENSDSDSNNRINNYNTMAPSSVHPVNRNTTHANHTTTTNSNVVGSNNPAASVNPTSQQHLRKMVTFKLPPSSTTNDTLHQRTSSAPPLYRSISESSLINCSTISGEQNEMPIQLRNQRNLPQKPLNRHPMSPTLPIAKLRLFKELNLIQKDGHQPTLSRNSTMYNLNNINTMNNYNNNNLNSALWPKRNNIVFDPRFQQTTGQYGQTTGLSKYSHSLPNSPSKRPMYNQYYNQLNQRHLSSVPSYQPVDCYTVGPTGILTAHGSRFPIPPMNSTSPHNFNSISPQTSSLPTYSQITKPPFLDDPYLHRTGLYNPLLYDKTLQRLKQRIPVCKSAPLSSIMANSLPTTNRFNTHDNVTGIPRRRHTTTSLAKSSLSPKINLGTGQSIKPLILDGTIEQEDSPLTQIRKEIKYFVDQRKRYLEQGNLDLNNLNSNSLFTGHTSINLTIPGNLTGKYLGSSNSNLSNSTALFNDQSPLSGTNYLHTSPNLMNSATAATGLAHNRTNYLSSSESDLNALLNLYSYPPDPVLDRTPPAGTSVFQRLPQYYLNRSKNRFTVDDLRRHRHPLLDYDVNFYNQYYGNQYCDPLIDQNSLSYYQNQLLNPTSTYHSLIDWPSSYPSYSTNTRPDYYASTGSLRTFQNPNLLTNNLNSFNRSNLIGGANNTYNSNYRLYDQTNLLGENYLPTNTDYHHYSLDTLGIDRALSRPCSPYFNNIVPTPAPIDHYTTQHSLSTNQLDSIDLNNNLLSKSVLGQTTSTLPLRSYRL